MPALARRRNRRRVRSRVRRDGRALGCKPAERRPGAGRFEHLSRVEVAHADESRLPLLDEARSARIVSSSGCELGQCKQIEIEVVAAQAPQAALGSRDRSGVGCVARQHLGRDEEPLARCPRSRRRPAPRRVPVPYISAVSRCVIPSSMPRRSARCASRKPAPLSGMFHVPCPMTHSPRRSFRTV